LLQTFSNNRCGTIFKIKPSFPRQSVSIALIARNILNHITPSLFTGLLLEDAIGMNSLTTSPIIHIRPSKKPSPNAAGTMFSILGQALAKNRLDRFYQGSKGAR
jgi:hypothetical protein